MLMNRGRIVPFHPQLQISPWMHANVLRIFTVAISSIDNMAVTLYRPQLSQISSSHLYLSYNADGPGNYDGTKELTQ